MKKLLFLLIGTLLTLSLSAHRPFHTLTVEDIEVHETLMELRAEGDIILPMIHVVAYAPQDTSRVKAQSQDKTRTRENDGQGKMTRAEKKEMKKMKKENHGAVVSETAKGTPSGPGKGEAVSGAAKQNKAGIQQHDRDQIHKPAYPTHQMHAKPASTTVKPPMGTPQKGKK